MLGVPCTDLEPRDADDTRKERGPKVVSLSSAGQEVSDGVTAHKDGSSVIDAEPETLKEWEARMPCYTKVCPLHPISICRVPCELYAQWRREKPGDGVLNEMPRLVGAYHIAFFDVNGDKHVLRVETLDMCTIGEGCHVSNYMVSQEVFDRIFVLLEGKP